MEEFFLRLYRFFSTRKPAFRIVFAALVLALAAGASRIDLEEDITRFFPNDARVEKLNYVFQNSKLVERLVIMVSVADSAAHPEPDSLTALAGALINRMDTVLKPYVKNIVSRVDDDKVMDVFRTVHDHLPVFLEESDYAQLDTLTAPEQVQRTLANHYRQLISPAGIAVKKIIAQDPLGFSFLVLKKLQRLQYDENFELYDNYIVTRDHRHLIFFLQPVYPPTETGRNTVFIRELNQLLADQSVQHPGYRASGFGAAVVAVGNARQLRKDTILTVSLTVVFLAVFLIGFFRKKRVLVYIFMPVVFGALFALCCIYLIKGSVSILALAAGSVILGIAVNYALHFLADVRRAHDMEHVIRDLVRPMTLGSTTTVIAFFSLQFTNAAVLRDVGLFAGFSLIGAALCTLIFLPHFLTVPRKDQRQPAHWMERVAQAGLDSNRWWVIGVLVLTPVFMYLAQDVRFNTDMGRLNFMDDATREAQLRLETINRASLTSVYVVSDGHDLQEALRHNERTAPVLEQLRLNGKVNKYSSVSTFLVSDSLQQLRLKRWNDFWTPERRTRAAAAVHAEGAALHFSPTVLTQFDSLVTRRFTVADSAALSSFRAAFFDDYIIQKHGTATVITLANVPPQHKPEVYAALSSTPAHAFDKQMITNLFVEFVHADFSFIVTFTAILVFMALLVSYGRIELTLITFVPMFITWVWILGIMGLFGIEFNIINVMVSTFIFGLGDDYSIFVMDGLQQEYRTGKRSLPSIRTSIFLSAVTTICGLGVLIFAQHPALRSIATISIIGIVCVFIMSQTVEPFLFRMLITNRTQKGQAPATFWGMCNTIFMYTFFVVGSLFLTVVGLLLKLVPFRRKAVRLLYHRLIRFFTGALVYFAANLKKRVTGRTPDTFAKASVIVANHSSFLDILCTTMLHPRLILLTNKWVWNSPIFGGVVRLADYYPVMEGADESIDRLKQRVAEGYSVVVFPEGTRSADGKIGRFHKGAFYLAEALHVPITPLLIHGASDAIPKTSIYLNDAHVTLKFLPPIAPEDAHFGTGYSERTKSISRYFKAEYRRLAAEKETPDYFVYQLTRNYLYKGPVLEWYMRIKLRLEKNYAVFNDLVPRRANVLDLGCGYGFLCYMLQFLSEERTITGVDYDDDKIEVARHGYLRSPRLSFYAADVMTFPLKPYDAIIISDVLHYLAPKAQEQLLVRCFKALTPGGRLIVRDGDADLQERQKGTALTEFFSVKLLGFNKSTQDLSFVSGTALRRLVEAHGLTVTVLDQTKFTSNVIFVIDKPATAVAAESLSTD